MAGPSLEPTNI